METDLDMNNHSLINRTIKSNFIITGYYDRSKNEEYVLFGNYNIVSGIILPVNCKLKKVHFIISDLLSSYPLVFLKANNSRTFQRVGGSISQAAPNVLIYDFNLDAYESYLLYI